MTLLWLVVIPLLGGLLALGAERWQNDIPRYVALATLALELPPLWMASQGAGEGAWLTQLHWPWISRFGIGFHLALDGLSLLLIALTVLLGFMAVGCSWTEIKNRIGFFHFNLLWTLAGTIGVFLALDLFLFFCFWEVMLVPMYLLIAIWGHENRAYAAMKFFIFTQVSGLFMLVAILVLAFVHARVHGTFTFDYLTLLAERPDLGVARWILLGFLAAFVTKLPSVPLHTWLPDAHTQAPTGGSVILAGVLLKTGAYGVLRFVVPLFPEAAAEFAPIAMGLGVLSILYGAKLAFAQNDLKRLIAYTSVSHMGFVLLGAFAFNLQALQGVVATLLAHGISAAALFMIAGAVQERLHTRDMTQMGGFWTAAPRMGAVALFFFIAALGMPGLGNFVGEFLVLLGTYAAHPNMTAVAVLGLILAPLYALGVIQRVFHGPKGELLPADFGGREMVLMLTLIVATGWLGLYPKPVLDASSATMTRLAQSPSGKQP